MGVNAHLFGVNQAKLERFRPLDSIQKSHQILYDLNFLRQIESELELESGFVNRDVDHG